MYKEYGMVWYPQCLLNPLLPYFRVPFLRPYCQENCWVSIWTVACVQNVPQIDWEVYHLLYIIFSPFRKEESVLFFFSALFFPYYFPYISIVVAIEVLNPPYLPLFSRFLCSKNWWLQSLFYYLFSYRHRSSILSIENHATYLKK